MKKISTGINPTFVRKWTVEEAIREVIQNYLDSKSEFDCKGEIKLVNGKAIVRDFGPGIEMRHLALGISEKSDEAIGRFGKGLKQALLVLTREDRNPIIYSNGIKIEPTIEWNEDFETEIMHLNVSEAKGSAKKIKGTWIEFDCQEYELETAKSYFVVFLRGDMVKLTPELSLPGGSVYVNGSWVGSVENAMFSYHLNHDQGDKVMSSDRDMINKDALDQVAARIFAKVRSKKVVDMIISNLINSDETLKWETQVGFNRYASTDADLNFWKKAFYRVAGEHAVIGDLLADEASYRGYDVVTIYSGWFTDCLKYCGVKTASQVLSESKENVIEEVYPEGLMDIQKENYYKAIEAIEKLYADPGEVRLGVDLNAKAGIPKDRGTSYGMYLREDDVIYLRADLLFSFTDTLHTLLHEVVHKITGFHDQTAEYERALLDVSVKIITENFDEFK